MHRSSDDDRSTGRIPAFATSEDRRSAWARQMHGAPDSTGERAERSEYATLPAPYVRRMTINEATDDFAFSSTGLYGKTLRPQNGGPTRPTLPWTYGSGSISAIVKTKSTD